MAAKNPKGTHTAPPPPPPPQFHRGEHQRVVGQRGDERQKKYDGETHDSGRPWFVEGVDSHEKGHRKERQQRLPGMHGSPDHVAGEEKLDQRDEVEDHAQAGGVQRDAAEKVAGTAEREEGVDQPDEVAAEREAQPEQCHRLGKYQSPLSLMQVTTNQNPRPIPFTDYNLPLGWDDEERE